MQLKARKNTQAGFSLIEVLIFITVMSIFFVSAAAVVSVVVKNMKVNEHKILGTRFAQEAVEWLRSEKEIDWNAFSQRAPSSGALAEYCLNSLAWNSMPCDYSLKTLYQRTVTLKSIESVGGYKYQVDVSVLVKWNEPGRSYSIPINTTFSIWEQ
jgi:type II secretory pathway pseudopilin PulG